jgi:tetratricopeptide (TPR) repeat protein
MLRSSRIFFVAFFVLALSALKSGEAEIKEGDTLVAVGMNYGLIITELPDRADPMSARVIRPLELGENVKVVGVADPYVIIAAFPDLGMIKSDLLLPPTEAIELFTRSLDKNRASQLRERMAEDFAARARAWAAKRDFQNAERDLAEAIKLDVPQNPAYLARGEIRYGRNQHQAASEDFSEAIRLDPKCGRAYLFRGLCRKMLDEVEDAVSDFGDAARLMPMHALPLVLRGEAYRSNGDLTSAVTDFTNSLKIEASAPAYFGRGQCFASVGKYGEAIIDFEQVIKRDDEHHEALAASAWILATCPDETVRDGRMAVQLATKAGDITKWKEWYPIHVLAAAHAESADFPAAIKRQQEAIGLLPEASTESLRKRLSDRLSLYQSGKPYRQPKK